MRVYLESPRPAKTLRGLGRLLWLLPRTAVIVTTGGR